MCKWAYDNSYSGIFWRVANLAKRIGMFSHYLALTDPANPCNFKLILASEVLETAIKAGHEDQETLKLAEEVANLLAPEM